jgi:hypothetical protein
LVGTFTGTAPKATAPVPATSTTPPSGSGRAPAWAATTSAEAQLEGIDGDCLAQACLFKAFAEFVSTYGEEAAARFAEGLAKRIRNGEFSLSLARQ